MDMGAAHHDGQPTVVGAGNDATTIWMRASSANQQPGHHSHGPHLPGGRHFRGTRLSENRLHAGRSRGCCCRDSAFITTTSRRMASWRGHVFSSHLVNTAAISVSRLAMHRYDQSANKNDIVSELGHSGQSGFGGPGAWGAPYFNVQGYSPMGDNYSPRPCTRGTRSSKAATR